jgi:enamine deaminase RidA (YjgF/YER057c/UK114 family)
MVAPIFHMIPNAPKPVAPYSHAVELDGWLFVTGQLATDPAFCLCAGRRFDADSPILPAAIAA